MAENNMSLIVVMVVTIVLLFTAMVLSSMASSAALTDCKEDTAHKYSMYTAVICGLSALITGIALGLYLYRDDIASGASKALTSAGQALKRE